MIDLNNDAGAIIVGSYRYHLWRNWDRSRPRLLWVMLNPSTADATCDDPTLKRCIAFSKRWGFGGLEVVNLFAYRATVPEELYRADDPIGGWNDCYLISAAKHAPEIVVAWGAHGVYQGRDRAVLSLLRRYAAHPLACLDTLLYGSPRHPLYVASDNLPQPYRRLAAIA